MKKLNVKNSTEEFTIGKIVCVGRNYAEHAKELGNEIPDEYPIIFLKPASTVIYSGGKVIHPSYSSNLHYETELVLLIGETITKADKEQAEKAIAGYGVGFDMTLRDLQNKAKAKGDPWTLAKCFDTATVVSDFVLKENCNLTMDESIMLKVNGQVKQHSQLNKMIFTPSELVKYISSVLTLEKGDLIFTGTPAGVGRVVQGDKLHAEITGVGNLDAEIVDAQ